MFAADRGFGPRKTEQYIEILICFRFTQDFICGNDKKVSLRGKRAIPLSPPVIAGGTRGIKTKWSRIVKNSFAREPARMQDIRPFFCGPTELRCYLPNIPELGKSDCGTRIIFPCRRFQANYEELAVIYSTKNAICRSAAAVDLGAAIRPADSAVGKLAGATGREPTTLRGR